MNKNQKPLRFSQLGAFALDAEPVITKLMADALNNPELLSLAAGFTDNILLPEGLVQEAVNALAEETNRCDYLQYGTNIGRPRLRQGVLELLRSYPGESGISLNSESVVITNGSQQALYISAQLFCEPGDIVLVEQPSYFVFLELIKGLGLRPVSIPAVNGRIDWEGFENLLSTLQSNGELFRVKLLYLMGVFANPSSRSLPESDKLKLATILKKLPVSIPVIEDMAYRELYFRDPYDARSLLVLEQWKDLPYLYAGTFTKPFATGIKAGFVVSPNGDWINGIARVKGHQDFGTSHLLQAILEYVLCSGKYQTHLTSIRTEYEEKANLLHEGLIKHGLRDMGWSWEKPEGGLLLWAEGPENFDTRIGSPFHQRCLDHSVLYVPGDLCLAEGNPYNAVRLSFGALAKDKIGEAAKRFCEAAATFGRSPL